MYFVLLVIIRMGKTRDIFNKMRDTKGKFHAKMGSVKDRNGKDLTKAEEIKKRWEEYTKELYKNGLNDLLNHDGVAVHLEPDTLECEVKWALRSITMNKASGGDGISDELHKILKMMLKCCTQYVSGLENLTMAIRLKKLVLIPIPKNCNARECSNYQTLSMLVRLC